MFFRLLLPVLIFAGCSATVEEAVKDDKPGTVQKPVFSIPPERMKDIATGLFIEGMGAEVKGDYNTAIEKFSEAIQFDESAGIYYSLAKNYYFIGRLANALNYSKKSIELGGEETDYLELLEEIYYSARQYDSSAIVLNRLIAIDSSNVNAYYKLARRYEDSKPLTAIGIYKKLMTLIGNDWVVLTRIAELYEKLDQPDEAIAAIEELLVLDPANLTVKKFLLDYYLKYKKYDKVISAADDILLLYPTDIDAIQKKGESLLRQNDWIAASAEYEKLIKDPAVIYDGKLGIAATFFAQSFKDSTMFPVAKSFFTIINGDSSSWQSNLYMGAIAVQEHQDSLAILYFQNVKENASWYLDTWIQLGALYYDNKRYDEAIVLLKEGVERFPDQFPVNFLLGLSYALSNKFEEAKPYLQKAIMLDKKSVDALSAYSYVLNKTGDVKGSIMYLEKALAYDPGNVDMMGTLGLYYENSKDFIKSDSIYLAALALAPDNALINNNYAYSLAERGIKLEEALKMAQKAVEKDPYSSSYLDTIGWIYFKLGDYAKAKEYITKAAELDPANAVILEHLGDVLYKLDEKDVAAGYWQKALDLDSKNEKLKNKVEKGEL